MSRSADRWCADMAGLAKYRIGLWLMMTVVSGYGFYWCGIRAIYNLWAAGGPPTDVPEQFMARANAFAVAAGVLLLSSILGLVMVGYTVGRTCAGEARSRGRDGRP